MKSTQLTSLLLFILLIFSIHKIIGLKQSNELNNVELSNTIKSLNKEVTGTQERLTIYYLICLEQNKVVELNKSSRIAKKNNIKLTELMEKL